MRPRPTTMRRDGYAVVICECGHWNIGTHFDNVGSGNQKDAWVQYKRHCDQKHLRNVLREFAEFVVSLDDVEMRTHITLTSLIRQARKALEASAPGTGASRKDNLGG